MIFAAGELTVRDFVLISSSGRLLFQETCICGMIANIASFVPSTPHSR
jgi:hypothetical protein